MPSRFAVNRTKAVYFCALDSDGLDAVSYASISNNSESGLIDDFFDRIQNSLPRWVHFIQGVIGAFAGYFLCAHYKIGLSYGFLPKVGGAFGFVIGFFFWPLLAWAIQTILCVAVLVGGVILIYWLFFVR